MPVIDNTELCDLITRWLTTHHQDTLKELTAQYNKEKEEQERTTGKPQKTEEKVEKRTEEERRRTEEERKRTDEERRRQRSKTRERRKSYAAGQWVSLDSLFN